LAGGISNLTDIKPEPHIQDVAVVASGMYRLPNLKPTEPVGRKSRRLRPFNRTHAGCITEDFERDQEIYVTVQRFIGTNARFKNPED